MELDILMNGIGITHQAGGRFDVLPRVDINEVLNIWRRLQRFI